MTTDFWSTPAYPDDRDEWRVGRVEDGFDDRPTAEEMRDEGLRQVELDDLEEADR